jgi:oligosaccharide reducing-end xylanase
MKNPFASFFLPLPAMIFLAMASAAVVGRAGSVAVPYEIGTWEGFRPAAITYTFDDNLPNQYTIAVPMFHAAGFKMTLFTVVNTWVGTFTWSQAQTAASYGDEIASHTMTHPSLTTVLAAQLTNELANSQSNINYRVTNEFCVTLAYPNCVVPNESIVAQFYIAARGCSGSLVSSTPLDFMNISSFVCGSQGSIQTPAQFNSLADSAATTHAWCVYLIHALDADNGYSPLPSATLQASLNYMSTNQNKFWVETFGNVARYIQERNASSVAETSNSGKSITLQVTNNLNNLIYNYPITLRRPVPANWPAVAVSQNNQRVTTKLVTVNSTNCVMFDVVPNGGEVVLTKSVLPFSMSNPVLTTPTNLTFRLDGQAGASYAICASTDLINWLPVQSNTLASTSANFTVEAFAGCQFFRAQWSP